MTLIVKEVFRTLQGEGYWSGTPSIFVRLAGCNLWSGREGHRVRDATRTGSRCPLFCDTDFVGGTPYTGTELAGKIAELAGSEITHVVFTGGEPLLQLERKHIVALRKALPAVRVAVETNGTVAPKTPGGVFSGIDWICLSPKLPPNQLEIDRGDEIKVVFPAYDPLKYEELASKFTHRFVSPEAPPTPGSLAARDVLGRAIEFCLAHPQWRLSLQAHKYLEIP
jgi:organic radical activating enzyme